MNPGLRHGTFDESVSRARCEDVLLACTAKFVRDVGETLKFEGGEAVVVFII
jgi:hypothetical protein